MPASPETCPICGADVPRGAPACPECGADERTGWNEEATRADGLDLPDAAFADAAPPLRPSSLRRALWVGLALLVLAALILRRVLH